MMFSSSVSISASLSLLVLAACCDSRPRPCCTCEKSTSSTASIGNGRCQRGAGLRGLRVLAEAGDDAAAAFVDDVEAAREPDERRRAATRMPTPAERQPSARPPPPPPRVVAVAALAAEELVHAAVDVAPDLVEIGRSAARYRACPTGDRSATSEYEEEPWRTGRMCECVGARARQASRAGAAQTPEHGTSAREIARPARRAIRRSRHRSMRSNERGEMVPDSSRSTPGGEVRPASILFRPGSAARRSAPISVEHRVHRRDLLVAIGVRGVDDVQQQVGLGGLGERRAERGDQVVRQVADEADGVGEHDRRRRPGT